MYKDYFIKFKNNVQDTEDIVYSLFENTHNLFQIGKLSYIVKPQKLFPLLLVLQGKLLENPLALQQNLLALHFCMIMSSPD